MAALVAGLAGAQHAAVAADEAELGRTWQAALVFRPDRPHARPPRIDQLSAMAETGGPRFPTVIYLHGCAGIDGAAFSTANFLTEAGFAVIMPDSFARKEKLVSCDPAHYRGGLHRAVLGWRQAEALNAIQAARSLPFVRADALFLLGFSEGAVTTATLSATGVRARIIEGWTCHAGWPEYHGLNAPLEEPVLALVADDDPWFRNPVLRGDCGPFLDSGNGSASIVFAAPHTLARSHSLLWQEDARRRVRAFLATHLPPAGDSK